LISINEGAGVIARFGARANGARVKWGNLAETWPVQGHGAGQVSHALNPDGTSSMPFLDCRPLSFQYWRGDPQLIPVGTEAEAFDQCAHGFPL
jgi:hypothetical protein